MVEESAAALDRLASGSNATRIGSIRKEMDAFGADPREYSEYLGEPSLKESGCGTHFYIIPADPIISDDIDNREALNKATLFERNLIGFTNTMTPGHRPPPIVAPVPRPRGRGIPFGVDRGPGVLHA